MANKGFRSRFPLRKLQQKKSYQKGQPQPPRKAGRGNKGISRREK